MTDEEFARCMAIDQTLQPSLGSIESAFTSVEYGIGVKQTYSYSTACTGFKYIQRNATADDIRKFVRMIYAYPVAWKDAKEHQHQLVEQYGKSVINAIASGSFPMWMITNREIEFFEKVDKFNAETMFIATDLKGEPKTDGYKNIFKGLLTGDPESTLKEIRKHGSEEINDIKDYCQEILKK